MYATLISETLMISPERARLVEAFLRLEHRTLDALSRSDIEREYAAGISDSIDEDQAGAVALADSFGL